ncbi:MAG: LysR family transcriptional regulator [Vulcanimicrobiaceae bacterium]
MDISLPQLRALRALGEHGSFTATAVALGVSQPAISQQLAGLSDALGVRLYDIVRNRPVLTQAGRFVLERATGIDEAVSALAREVREFAAAQRGSLHLAATLTIGNYVLPGLLAQFLQQRPRIRPTVEIVNTAAVASLVLNDSVSLGLVEGTVDEHQLEAIPFAEDRLVLAMRPDHRLAQAAKITLGDLEREPFVSREPGSGTRDFGYEILRERGVTPPILLELAGGEGIVRAVESGVGIALLSERVVERALAAGSLIAKSISGISLTRRFFAIKRRDRMLAPVAQAFFELVMQAREHTPIRGKA